MTGNPLRHPSWIHQRPMTFMPRLIMIAGVVYTLVCHQTIAQPQPREKKIPRGAYTTSFTKRTPVSRLATLQKQFRRSIKDESAADYDISKETYEVYVPESYEPGMPYGLLVWIHGADDGTAPKQWWPVLDKRFLIWVGANESGNQHDVYRRFALALDAVLNMTQRYTIDRERIYAAGFSGGGRVASELTPTYPRVFQGGLFLCGANYFRAIPKGNGRAWPGTFPAPSKLAKARSRFVLLTGDNDPNLKNTRAVYECFKQDRFRYATYLQIPGHDHEIPNAEWFEKGIAALDQPLAKSAGKSLRLAAGLEKSHKYGKAWLEYTKAYVRGIDQDFAAQAKNKADAIRDQYQHELGQARQLVQNGEYGKATAQLRKIMAQYQTLAGNDVDQLNEKIRADRRNQNP